MEHAPKSVSQTPAAKVTQPMQQDAVHAPAFQFKDNRSEASAQGNIQSLADQSSTNPALVQLKTIIGNSENPVLRKNTTGMPDTLKSGVENLSGIDMSDVKVHYNSSQPAQLNAHAYAQGTNIHIAPGQEKHLPHEAWHVVQQKQGRVKSTMQMKKGVAINDDKGLEKEADVMGGKAIAVSQGNLQKMPIDNFQTSGLVQMQKEFPIIKGNTSIVQRIIIGYSADCPMSKTMNVMTGLTYEQRAVVQELHGDNEGNEYSEEDARAQAIEEKPVAADNMDVVLDEEESKNPYSWKVIQNAAFNSVDLSIQSIVNNFGHPTQAVMAVYMNLGERIGAEVQNSPKAILSQGLESEIYQLLDAQIPLHFGDNPFLTTFWEGNLEAYNGQKSGKQLYTVLRTKLTKDLLKVNNSVCDFNGILKAVSGRPPEVHHFLYKAIYGEKAINKLNLGLVERSQSEKDYGKGQHELIHYVASGASKDKFNVLTQQFVNIYNKWVKDRYGKWLLDPLI